MSWSGAAKHYEGAGLGGGVDFTAPRTFLRKLEKEGSFEAAGMIRHVLTAGFWTEDRLAKAGYESSTNG
eukprot:1736694-Pyramimonas_sp.AAC.1